MNRRCFWHAFSAVALAALVSTGCQRKAPNTQAAKPAPPTPEESFTLIVETFRRDVEDLPIGFDVQDASGRRTMMTGRSTVSHELLPPEKEGDPFRAKITVKSNTQYSLQRSTEGPDSDESDQANEPAANGSIGGNDDVQVFDPTVASAKGESGAERRATSSKADKNAETIARTDNISERTYELVHENGKWKLLTKLDLNTEESIKLAFDRALETQS